MVEKKPKRSFAELSDVGNWVKRILDESNAFIESCKEDGTDPFESWGEESGVTEYILQFWANMLGEGEVTDDETRFYLQPVVLHGAVTGRILRVLLGLCEELGVALSICPPMSSEYGGGSWKVVFAEAKSAAQ